MNSTEIEMIKSVFKGKKALCTNYDIGVPNCYTTHDNEADLFFIRSSGFCDEIEIKVSRSDLLADKNKRVHFKDSEPSEWDWKKQGLPFAPYTKPKYDALHEGLMMPNYFWYAIKDGIGGMEDIPKFAGLITVNEAGLLRVLRMPDRLHKRKLTDAEKYKISKKCCYRFWRSEFGISF